MSRRDRTFRVAIRKFGPFESAIRKQWELFEQRAYTGLELEAEAFELHPLHEVLFEAGGLRNGEWDVAFISTDWLAEAAGSRTLADISPNLISDAPEGYPHSWPDSLLRMQAVDGQVLGLPYHDGPECLIFRKDLLEREGAIPQTWEEYHHAARSLACPKENLYGTAFAAYPDGHNTVYDFCLQLWSRGGELFDERGRATLQTTPAIDALKFYRTILNDASAIHPKCREFDSVQSGLAFARGEIAMMVNWFGFAAMCETVADSKVKNKIGVARVPRGANGSHVSLNAYWILGMSSSTLHQEAAWLFLQHCASAEMDKLLTLEGAIGCRRSTWSDCEINATIPFYRELERFHEDARELPRLTQWNEISSVLDEMVLKAINTDQPESILLERAEAAVNALL